MNMLVGAGIGLVITLVVAKFFAVGRTSGASEFGASFALAFRIVAEAVLIAVFAGALIATAVLGTAAAWQLFAGYAIVRGVALVLEVAKVARG